MDVATVNGVPIRLTDERWDHIVERHERLGQMKAEILTAVSAPSAVVEGATDEFWPIRRWEAQWTVVPYRELSDRDGFVITALVGQPPDVPQDFDSYYDREADVLYVTFAHGIEDDSLLTPDDIVLRYREGRLLSVTVLHASKREGLHVDA